MKYSLVIRFPTMGSVYDKDFELNRLEKIANECIENEKQEIQERHELYQFEMEIAKKYQIGQFKQRNPHAIEAFGVMAEGYVFFPHFIVTLTRMNSFSKVMLNSTNNIEAYCSICNLPDEDFFEFVVAKDKKIIWQYCRKNKMVCVFEQTELSLEVPFLQNSRFPDALFDSTLSSAEIANLFSKVTSIPILFGKNEKGRNFITNLTDSEESGRNIAKLNRRRPFLTNVEKFEMGITLNEAHILFQSKYIVAYEPLESTLEKFADRMPHITKSYSKIERIDPFAKTTCLHIFREDLPEDILGQVITWCENNSEEYSILLEPQFIGIWCYEWNREPAEICYYHLQETFNCRALGLWMHDDLFFSFSLMKGGKVIAEASFGEGGPTINNPLIAQQEFGIELPLLENYEDATALLEKIDCYAIQPGITSYAEMIQEHPHGKVYACPSLHNQRNP